LLLSLSLLLNSLILAVTAVEDTIHQTIEESIILLSLLKNFDRTYHIYEILDIKTIKNQSEYGFINFIVSIAFSQSRAEGIKLLANIAIENFSSGNKGNITKATTKNLRVCISSSLLRFSFIFSK
jgi:hypothetical protein